MEKDNPTQTECIEAGDFSLFDTLVTDEDLETAGSGSGQKPTTWSDCFTKQGGSEC